MAREFACARTASVRAVPRPQAWGTSHPLCGTHRAPISVPN